MATLEDFENIDIRVGIVTEITPFTQGKYSKRTPCSTSSTRTATVSLSSRNICECGDAGREGSRPVN